MPRLGHSAEVESEIAAAVSRPGVIVIVPQRPIGDAGNSASAFVVADGNGGSDFRIFDGESGGLIKFLTGPTIGVMLFTLAGYPDDLSACLFLLIDLYRIFTFPAFAAMIAPLLGTMLVITGIAVPIAMVLVAIVLTAYLLFAIQNALRDGWLCVNGEPGFPT